MGRMEKVKSEEVKSLSGEPAEAEASVEEEKFWVQYPFDQSKFDPESSSD